MSRVVYARGFPSSFTSEDLKIVFKTFGKLRNARIINQEEKLFAIVTFYDPAKAQKAIQGLNNRNVGGIDWYVAECEKLKIRNSPQKKNARKIENRQKTLYLRGFPESFNEDQVRAIFSRYGNISKVLINEKVCFVTFEGKESAAEAFNNEKLLQVEGKRVFVNILVDKQTLACMMMNKKSLKERWRNKRRNRDVEMPMINSDI